VGTGATASELVEFEENFVVGQNESDGSDYGARVGQRLRSIRKQKGLSMHDVEASSGGEFRASVIGAYERGERAISVPRLNRLAVLYAVPVGELLPMEPISVDRVIDLDARDVHAGVASACPTIDLTRLAVLGGAEAEMLRRYVAHIQVERQDYDGGALRVRRSDLGALGAILGVTPDSVVGQFRDLGLVLAEHSAVGSAH
jgi:transcriptional regulator with XRE-family HTH domain